VHVKSDQTLKMALKKAMAMRDLTTSQCAAFVVQPNKPVHNRHMVDWAICTSALAGQEVGGAGWDYMGGWGWMGMDEMGGWG